MLRRFALLFVCAVLPLSLASADGFPSRPTFQDVTVRDGITATDATISNSLKVDDAGIGSIELHDGGLRKSSSGFLQIQHLSNGVILISTTSQLQLEYGELYQNGVSQPITQAARFSNSALNSTTSPGTSWSRLGTGEYRITWVQPFDNPPICSATSAGTLGETIYPKINGTAPDEAFVEVVVTNFSGTVTDIPANARVNLICVM